MRKIGVVVLALIFSSAVLCGSDDLFRKARGAVGLLYAQDAAGGLTMRCSLIAYDRTLSGYVLATAAHCIGPDDTEKVRSAHGGATPFYVTFDERDSPKRFYRAGIVWVGYQHRGDDFAKLVITTTDAWSSMPLGDEAKEEDGAPIINLASPMGLGIQSFRGIISKVVIDRPIIDEASGVNWQGAMMLQLAGVAGGSSGSPVISEKQEAVVGLVVGTIGGTTVIAMPISRFKVVDAAVKARAYAPWVSAGN